MGRLSRGCFCPLQEGQDGQGAANTTEDSDWPSARATNAAFLVAECRTGRDMVLTFRAQRASGWCHCCARRICTLVGVILVDSVTRRREGYGNSLMYHSTSLFVTSAAGGRLGAAASSTDWSVT